MSLKLVQPFVTTKKNKRNKIIDDSLSFVSIPNKLVKNLDTLKLNYDFKIFIIHPFFVFYNAAFYTFSPKKLSQLYTSYEIHVAL